MSTLSLPSSPESVSDEDNHPNRRHWWEEAEEEPPRRGRRQRRGRCTAPVESESPFVHNPDPDEVKKIANRSDNAICHRLAILEKKEKKELAAEEKKAAREWRAPNHWDRAMKRLREDNLRALSNAEMADRSAEWRKAAGGE